MREKILDCIRNNLQQVAPSNDILESEYVDPATITEDTMLSDLEMNSVKLIYLLIAIEKTFSISIGDQNLNYKKYQNLKDLIDMIEEEINKAGKNDPQ